MKTDELIEKTKAYAESTLRGETNAHDWWHVYRVWKMAIQLARQEHGADRVVVELAALLHDIADWKFHNGDTEIGPKKTREWLESQGADPTLIEKVECIVRHVSYRGGTNTHAMQSLEGKIVQDADRLDAIGAIGIARTFAFGGAFGREIYEPGVRPKDYASFKDFQAQMKGNHTINHFYEKLLLLKDKLNTESARAIALRRHAYMEQFLEEFYAEWDGER